MSRVLVAIALTAASWLSVPGRACAEENETPGSAAAPAPAAAPPSSAAREEADKDQDKDPASEKSKNGKGCPKPRRTLLEWAISHDQDGEDEEPEEGPIDTDRPDFTEATTTVGLGTIQLETGYTYFYDSFGGPHTHRHSYPEALLRIGMFAEWFELRIGQNFANLRTTGLALTEGIDGAEDLYLGVKLALTEQAGCLPESVIILQTFVPTGTRGFSAEEMLPGAGYVYTWDVIENCLALSGMFHATRALDDSNHYYVNVLQTFEAKFEWTDRLGSFLEWDAFYPAGAIDPGVGPEHYVHVGATFLVTDDIQLDAHAAWGLNDHAADFFIGAGLSLRL